MANKSLKSLFNIADEPETNEPKTQMTLVTEKAVTMQNNLKELDKIDNALEPINAFDRESDAELDELAQIAVDGYRDMLDKADAVPPNMGLPMYKAATDLLGHAINAKTNKIKKKLDLINLQIRKQKLDQDAAKTKPEEETATGRIIDRNQLLEILRNPSQKNTD